MTDNCLNQQWACLVCNSTFAAGRIISRPSTGKWHCPNCDSPEPVAADGAVREVPDYLYAGRPDVTFN